MIPPHFRVRFHLSFLLGSPEMFNGDNSKLIKGWHSCQVHYEIVFYFISQQTCICLFHDAVTLWLYTCARMCRAHRITICFPIISSPMACMLAETTGHFGNRLHVISSPALHGSVRPVLLSSKRFPSEVATLALLQLGVRSHCS